MDILYKYFPAFLDGVSVTFSMALTSWFLGCLLGGVLGFLSLHTSFIRTGLSLVGFVVGAIPVLVILFWVHYPLQETLGLVISPYISSVLIFSFLNMLMVAQAVVNGADTIPKEYLECAAVYGLSKPRSFLKIELPLILRSAMSNIINVQVVILHMTLFASLISVDELFRVAQRVNSIEYKPVEIYTIIGLFYIIVSMPLLFFSRVCKNNFDSMINRGT